MGRFLVGLLILLVLFSGCIGEKNVNEEPGFLEGVVAIGPLCPVEPCSISPEHLASFYAARKVIINSADSGSTHDLIVSINVNGSYHVALSPGIYSIDVNHTRIGGSGELPKEILIESGKTTKLDINIDTGIR